MSEEDKRFIPDSRSLEERVFARFDDLDARFDAMVSCPQKIETASELRSVEHKAWEQLLAQIEELRRGVVEFRKEVRTALSDLLR